MRVNIIEDKLLKLSDQYAEVYPKFVLAERAYTLKYAEVMMEQDVLALASQPLRDKMAEKLISETSEYVEYFKIMPEFMVINKQIMIWTKLAQLTTYGGDYGK